ncbi:MAG: hypothetical protein CM15mP46_0900 [Alphaproteobacteria bacterium]|nr:MAG: hypothetical protein CM15mP46_0900 [Alphaproteobacteria bacterium]
MEKGNLLTWVLGGGPGPFFLRFFFYGVSAKTAKKVDMGHHAQYQSIGKKRGNPLVETKISQIIEAAIEELGFSLVRILYSGGQAGRNQLQIMAEPKADREMTVEDCQMISRHVSALLDVEDPISSAYVLEVSSPGIDRPLTRLTDYERFQGELAKITLRLMQDGRRRFNGRLGGISDDLGW